MRFQPEFNQLRVFRVVVVLLGLHSRVGDMIDLDGKVQLLPRGLYHSRQVQNRKLFGELVENPALSLSRRIQTGNLDAAHGVPNIEKTAGLSSLAVNGERMPNGRLNAEAIE